MLNFEKEISEKMERLYGDVTTAQWKLGMELMERK